MAFFTVYFELIVADLTTVFVCELHALFDIFEICSNLRWHVVMGSITKVYGLGGLQKRQGIIIGIHMM